MINFENFLSNSLKVNEKSYKNTDIYFTEYLTINSISDYNSLSCVNPLQFIIGEVDGYIEKKNGNKYLTFAFTDKNKEVLEKCTKFWDEIKYLIKTINGSKAGEPEKDFMKIKFSAEDNLPLNKILKLHMLRVIVRCVFQENGKYIHNFLQMNICMSHKCQSMIELTFQKELILSIGIFR